MLTTISQFTEGILLIEGVEDDTNDIAKIAINDHLNSYIKIYENKYLRKLLGFDMADEFIEHLKNSNSPAEVTDKWRDIEDLFEKCDVSPIACYVFFHFVKENQTKVTLSGVLKPNMDNPLTSPMQKTVTAWNMMVTTNHNLYRWIEKRRKVYPDFDPDEEILDFVNEFNI